MARRIPVELGLVPTQGVEVPDFHALMAELRRDASRVAIVDFAGRPAPLVTRHDDVVALLRDEARFSSRLLHEANSFPVMGRNLMGMEGEEHRRKKALIAPAFRLARVRKRVESDLRPLCHALVDRFAARGEADLVAEFTKGFPLAVICRLLGVPVADEADYQRWAMALISYAILPDEAALASKRFSEALGPLLAARRAEPRDDLLSDLARAELDGLRLADEEIFAFVRALFAAGTDTTYNAMGALLHALLTHPDALARVREDPAARPVAVAELLRWNGPVGVLPRICAADTELHGAPVAAGQTVLAGLASANRDEAVHREADRFDLDRSDTDTLYFGVGDHFCVGAALARSELEVALDVVLERLEAIELRDEAIRFPGCILRGPEALPVRFRAT